QFLNAFEHGFALGALAAACERGTKHALHFRAGVQGPLEIGSGQNPISVAVQAVKPLGRALELLASDGACGVSVMASRQPLPAVTTLAGMEPALSLSGQIPIDVLHELGDSYPGDSPAHLFDKPPDVDGVGQVEFVTTYRRALARRLRQA